MMDGSQLSTPRQSWRNVQNDARGSKLVELGYFGEATRFGPRDEETPPAEGDASV